mmetsp:Transcript_28810/g.40411  ORF Transcript_28810/g.40411 Transcript_28810/m.40411 type:complete len:664 (+) Transcript_28810:119-2110(+)
MDELTDAIGQLSTKAKEWKPGGNYTTTASSASNSNVTGISALPLHSPGTNPTSPPFQPSSFNNNVAMSPTSPSQLGGGNPVLRTSAMRHSPPGRNHNNVLPDNAAQSWQLQPRNEWNPESVVSATSAGAREFVPGGNNTWDGRLSEQPQNAQSWNEPASPHGTLNEQEHDLQQWQSHQEAAAIVPEGPTTLPVGPAPPPPVRSIHGLGMADSLWQYYRDISLDCRREMDHSDPRHKAIPPSFLNPYPLDENTGKNNKKKGSGGSSNTKGGSSSTGRSSFGYPTSIFKVMSRDDGHLYCLRRLDNVRSVSYKIAAAVTERWTTARNVTTGAPIVEHPGIVRFYRMFLSNRAVFFIHEYVPGCRTLRERFLDVNAGGGMPFPEPLIWSCITQLTSAIRAVHGANLACRTLQLNHILCSTPNWSWNDGDMNRLRLRINCIGIIDALEFEARKGLAELHREDMIDLGHLILSFATGNEITRRNCDIGRLDVYLVQNFSRQLHALVMSILRPMNPPSIADVSSAIAGRVFDELDAGHTMVDRSDAALAAEYESGRALRLLLKFGFVNERPEFAMNRRWSESGDCYVLKLFRDYVFHQADGTGRPIMDLGHVITCMNKLDAADEEKIVLASRDGKSLLVVSYADVAHCLDTAFNELCSGSVSRFNHGGN